MSEPAPSASSANAPQAPRPVATWRKVVAAILDFFFIFLVGGYAIGYFTGGITDEGFNLVGAPAFFLFAIIVLYFVVFSRYLGGTLFQRLLAAR